MAPALPDDILHVLCEELANLRQFDTLFNCACASRVLAVPALTNLYRSHHEAPIRGGGDDALGTPLAQRLLVTQRWSILWKSIIASSLGTTMFPYCRYIKTLDFRDLGNLFGDEQFRSEVQMHFFSGPLKQFERTEQRKSASGNKWTSLLDADTIEAIGEAVTQHTPMLETISGELKSDALVRWTSRLPRLQNLELFDGRPLENPLVHTSLHEYCSNFNELMIYTWSQEDLMSDHRDQKFAQFLSSMRADSLKSLQTMHDIGADAETFSALSHHGGSLEDLGMYTSNESLSHLNMLQGCTALRQLRIEDTHGVVDLQATQNDVFLETIAWLSKCKGLRVIRFSNFASGAALMTPVLLEQDIRLEHLEIDSYVLKDHKTFHQALVHQQSHMIELSLNGEPDGMFRDDLDTLVDSLKQLKAMRRLSLTLPEVLRDEHIVAIFQNLKQLETIYVTGLEINDDVLPTIGGLPNLRDVTLSGISKFTVDGLFDFISMLGTGNQGIRVIIDQADPDTALTDENQAVLSKYIAEHSGGTFDYTLFRGLLHLVAGAICCNTC
ncbi:uncharacterized protein M421DRAFT_399080 [Didymella exigua CBS 183.55]|uniref:RNI-like protein n=1 Tax=Didymella exigua CBS 183.55 TaxID=1150837 RepID=A0A6A5RXR4_9PLEO|nr:uncharacterized protein M421DRAFT_399080 [Didymella exigua CBS 183.55]KAF1932642.1 hypothetical protein M421DRAFT_399080 [Didymella exigua CBS 183.55]